MSGRQTTIGRTSALRRLGVTGDQLPGLGADEWPGVYIMGALGSLTTEPFEARGLAGNLYTAPTGRPAIELVAVGGGGLVVERLLLNIPAVAGGGSVEFRVRAPVGLATPEHVENVGGASVRGRVASSDNAGSIGPSSVIPAALSRVLERMVVPAGSAMVLRSNHTNQEFQWSLLWRELEDVQGAPS